MPRKLAPDLWLFGVAVVLLSVGVVMVYSASAIVAGDRFHDPYFFLKRQLCWALLGAAGLWVALRVDYRRLERFVLPLLVVSVALLVLVLIPPIGQAINGTRRTASGGSPRSSTRGRTRAAAGSRSSSRGSRSATAACWARASAPRSRNCSTCPRRTRTSSLRSSARSWDSSARRG